MALCGLVFILLEFHPTGTNILKKYKLSQLTDGINVNSVS